MPHIAQTDCTSAVGHLSSCVLASLHRMIASNNADADAAQTRLQALEQAPWCSEKMRALETAGMLSHLASSPAKTAADELAEAHTKIELLERKLAATNAELLRCQTQLYAYEREIRALLAESTALESELAAAQAQGLVPASPPVPDPLQEPEGTASDAPHGDDGDSADDPDADEPHTGPRSLPVLYIAEEEPSSSSPLPRAAGPGAPIRSLNV